MKCPCCNGTGKVDGPPVHMSPMQNRVWDIVRHAADGIESAALIDRIYADRADGGPAYASKTVHVAICRLNKRLRLVDQRIHGVGSVYRLETVHQEGGRPC